MLAAQIVQMAACAIVVSYAAALAGVAPAVARVSGMRTTNTVNAQPATAASVRNVAGKPKAVARNPAATLLKAPPKP